ncbi:MAG: DUF2231 domain-containing protein [Acidimicrobiia bacterium]
MGPQRWRPGDLGDRLDTLEGIDRVAVPAQRAVAAALPGGRLKDGLHGVWLGHPLHPVLTDLPIGFWTGAWVLDLVGGRSARPAADRLVGLGVVTALPTAAAGLADWSVLPEPERRSGAVHAMANLTATALYAASYVARRRGHRSTGVALGMAGAAAATIGGYLGGHLTFRRSVGPNRAAAASSTPDWTAVAGLEGPVDERLAAGELDGTPVVVTGTEHGPVALADRCTHLGGPLHEGTRIDGCVRCPWHGSRFRLADGRVALGPAVAPQPAYELRSRGSALEGRRRPPP